MRIFVIGMKKTILIVAYWLVSIFLTAILLTSLDYDLWQAVLMSLSFLPAAMALSFFLPKVERDAHRKKRLKDSVFIILGVMLMTFMLIFLWQWLFIDVFGLNGQERWSLPSMLGNPVFVAAVLAILAYGYYLLARWLDKKYPAEHPVTFTSDYRKVSLKRGDILYVESHDSEVWIITRDGRRYRNRNGITQWENLLGRGFIRIHRSFLVNLASASLSSPDTVRIGETDLPVSRKYKDSVKTLLAKASPHPEDRSE